MLVAFTVGNFRSFKEPAMLSMVPIRRLKGEERFDSTHLIETGNRHYRSLLKIAAIYGANASGKSNLLLGLSRMCEFVFDNLKELRHEQTPINNPFAFEKSSLKSPTLYEIQFLTKTHLYRYGFEIEGQRVVEEWLYRDEEELFRRIGEEIVLGESFKEGNGKETQTRKDALFLTVCGSYNGPISTEIMSLFRSMKMWGLKSRYRPPIGYIISQYLDDARISEKLRELIRLADPGISDFRRETEKITKPLINPQTGEMKNVEDEIVTFAAVYDCDHANNTLQMDDLSSGTIKMISTAGSILQAIHEEGIVVIDEIDIQLHPLLIEMVLETFHSHPTSKAQLIFTTHNTYPLRKKLLRRDQVWFVNKAPDFSSQLVNFAEFKVRPDASYEKGYLDGRFGGIPTMEISEIF